MMKPPSGALELNDDSLDSDPASMTLSGRGRSAMEFTKLRWPRPITPRNEVGT